MSTLVRRVFLSDNGAEFRNKVLQEICSQFGISQTFTAAYHPPSDALIEGTNKKSLDVLRPIFIIIKYNIEGSV